MRIIYIIDIWGKEVDMQRLYKDKKNRMLGGVCAGIAGYTGFDVTLVRAVSVILNLTFTPLVTVYFLLMLILPDRSEVEAGKAVNLSELRDSLKEGNTFAYIKTGALAVLAVSAVLLLTESFFHVDIKLKYIIIFALIIFGLYLMTTKDLHRNPSRRVISGAALCILTLIWLASSAGFLFFPIAILISTMTGMWPILLAALGVSLLLQDKRHITVLWASVIALGAVITVLNFF